MQTIGTLTTTAGFQYGNYVFTTAYLISNGANPQVGGTRRAAEVYSVGHVKWSAGKVLGQSSAFGSASDVGFTAGYEFGAKDVAFKQYVRTIAPGQTLELAVARGLAVLTLGERHATHYSGVTHVHTHTDLNYNAAWHVAGAWMVPFKLGPGHVVFKGNASITGPKRLDGCHVQTETQTQTQTLTRMAPLLDVGVLSGTPRTFLHRPRLRGPAQHVRPALVRGAGHQARSPRCWPAKRIAEA